MKQYLIFSAGRIMMMTLAVVLTFGLTGCSKDDDGEVKPGVDKNLTGSWLYKESDDSEAFWVKITFNSDGTGTVLNSEHTSGTFEYQVISPNYSMSVNSVMYHDGDVTKLTETWKYHVEGNTLTLNELTFRRN